jgi:branched-chain amino acid aminotransferase
MVEPVDVIWVDGELVPWESATVHLSAHALHYGSGVFEGIRAYDTPRGTAIFRLPDHVRRLLRSAHLYHMPVPYSEEELIQACKDTVRANRMDSCYIRPLIFRGLGPMGVNPLDSAVVVSILVWKWGAYLGEDALESGVRVKVSSWKRNDQNMLPPGAKATGQYLNSQLAKMESIFCGYDEGIMLNSAGYITDGSGENLFIVKEGELLTPPVSAGCLDGITRLVVTRLARDLGYQVHERNLSRFDLYTADEAFFTGTAAEVTPIREVDDRVVSSGGRGPITKEIQSTFFDIVHGRVEEYFDCLTHIDR